MSHHDARSLAPSGPSGPGEAAVSTAPPSPAQRHDGVTPERQRIFIETLASTGSVSRAAKACGLSRQALYAYRNRADVPAFRAAWEVAVSCAVNMLSDIAMDRAIEGVEEPVYWKGEQIGTRRRYNDRLLIQLLQNVEAQSRPTPAPKGTYQVTRRYVTRPRLDGALLAMDLEADGELDFAYDDDPRGPAEHFE